MTLRDPGRDRSFEVDEAVRRALAEWSKERDSEIGRINLKRAVSKLNPDQRSQMIDRMAEISLGLLFALLQSE